MECGSWVDMNWCCVVLFVRVGCCLFVIIVVAVGMGGMEVRMCYITSTEKKNHVQIR